MRIERAFTIVQMNDNYAFLVYPGKCFRHEIALCKGANNK